MFSQIALYYPNVRASIHVCTHACVIQLMLVYSFLRNLQFFLLGVASENEKNRTLSVCRGWHPAVQRRNGHAEVLGHVCGVVKKLVTKNRYRAGTF